MIYSQFNLWLPWSHDVELQKGMTCWKKWFNSAVGPNNETLVKGVHRVIKYIDVHRAFATSDCCRTMPVVWFTTQFPRVWLLGCDPLSMTLETALFLDTPCTFAPGDSLYSIASREAAIQRPSHLWTRNIRFGWIEVVAIGAPDICSKHVCLNNCVKITQSPFKCTTVGGWS